MKRAKLIQPPARSISPRNATRKSSLWRRASAEGYGMSGSGRGIGTRGLARGVGLQFRIQQQLRDKPQPFEHPMSTAKTKPPVALVTGAGKRIGRAISLGLAADGWSVALHFHHSRAETELLAAEIAARGGSAVALECDLSQPAQVSGLLA